MGWAADARAEFAGAMARELQLTAVRVDAIGDLLKVTLAHCDRPDMLDSVAAESRRRALHALEELCGDLLTEAQTLREHR